MPYVVCPDCSGGLVPCGCGAHGLLFGCPYCNRSGKRLCGKCQKGKIFISDAEHFKRLFHGSILPDLEPVKSSLAPEQKKRNEHLRDIRKYFIIKYPKLLELEIHKWPIKDVLLIDIKDPQQAMLTINLNSGDRIVFDNSGWGIFTQRNWLHPETVKVVNECIAVIKKTRSSDLEISGTCKWQLKL